MENKLQLCFKFTLGIKGELSEFADKFAQFSEFETKFTKKGTKISASAVPCDTDIFQYFSSCEYMRDLSLNEQEYQGQEIGFNAELRRFLEEVYVHKPLIDEMKKSGADCYIRVAIQSDEAQIFFEMFPEHILLLAKIGLKLEFSILSWGMVADL